MLMPSSKGWVKFSPYFLSHEELLKSWVSPSQGENSLEDATTPMPCNTGRARNGQLDLLKACLMPAANTGYSNRALGACLPVLSQHKQLTTCHQQQCMSILH